MTVERIYTRAVAHGPTLEHERVEVTAGSGIIGDRYYGKHDEPGQNITFIEAEELEAFLSGHDGPRDFSVTGRNVVTRGVRLNELVGREFTVGGVLFRGVALCEPCRILGEALKSEACAPPKVVKNLTHRAGLRADALTSGEIAIGAKFAGGAS
jgi:MOSC domain-containing protein YiiM